MKLSKLLENLKPVNIINYKNVNISNLSLKSKAKKITTRYSSIPNLSKFVFNANCSF